MKRSLGITLLMAGAALTLLVFARLSAVEPPDELALSASMPADMPQDIHQIFTFSRR